MEYLDPNSKDCALPQCVECKGGYKIFFLIFIIISFYFIILKLFYKSNQEKIQNDMLNVKVIDVPFLENCCSWWPISHFILFFVFGILFPQCGVLVISIGIGWEIFESILSYLTNSPERQVMRESTLSNDYEYSQNWWAGSFKDIIMNIFGYLTGLIIVKIFNLNISIKGINYS